MYRTIRKVASGMTLSAAILVAAAAPARADYREARARYDAMTPDAQGAIVLGLIASGDYEGLAEHGFTRLLYDAVRRFEAREGTRADGVIDRAELARLREVSSAFLARLGNRYYSHPETGARLLVPRKLFDGERTTDNGMLFFRNDGMLSLSFVSFPSGRKSFEELYATLSAATPDRKVIYKRRFPSHFVATGFFNGRKFYTWMARTGASTTGFTVSWSDAWEETGRKICVLLANAYLAGPR